MDSHSLLERPWWLKCLIAFTWFTAMLSILSSILCLSCFTGVLSANTFSFVVKSNGQLLRDNSATEDGTIGTYTDAAETEGNKDMSAMSGNTPTGDAQRGRRSRGTRRGPRAPPRVARASGRAAARPRPRTPGTPAKARRATTAVPRPPGGDPLLRQPASQVSKNSLVCNGFRARAALEPH